MDHDRMVREMCQPVKNMSTCRYSVSKKEQAAWEEVTTIFCISIGTRYFMYNILNLF